MQMTFRRQIIKQTKAIHSAIWEYCVESLIVYINTQDKYAYLF